MPAARRTRRARAPALPAVGIAIWRTPNACAIETATAMPRALNDAGRQPSLVLHQQLAPVHSGTRPRKRNQWRDLLAQADHVLGPAHRQQLAIPPQILRPALERSPIHDPADAVEVIPHQQRLARRRKVMKLARREALPGRAAFEMRDVGLGPLVQIALPLNPDRAPADRAPGTASRPRCSRPRKSSPG